MEEVMPLQFVCVLWEISSLVHYFSIKDRPLC